MTLRGWREAGVALVLSCHPAPALAMTVGLSAGAALSGRGAGGTLLVAATVSTGQLTVGWINDLHDADRDRLAGRRDKPVASGRVAPGTVRAATAVMAVLVVPLSLANGTASGLAHLAAVLSAWSYNLLLKRTVLSWLPYAVSFGLLPAFLSYGGVGFGRQGGPPTVAMSVLAALLGIGIHVLNTLPDLPEDRANGVRHLPLLVAERVGTPALRALGLTLTLTTATALVLTAATAGLRR